MSRKIITISRQYGSGGRFIGEMLAKKLNINFYDKELIDVVAEKTGINKEYLEAKEEKFTSDNLFFSAFHKDHFSSPFSSKATYSTLDKMFEIQSEVIKNIASKEECVIIGRCASFVLKDLYNCFNIFVHAPDKSRIERITSQYGVKLDQAETVLKNTDKYRANYYKYYTGEDWGNMTNYNLALDSGYFTDEDICQIIIEAIGHKKK